MLHNAVVLYRRTITFSYIVSTNHKIRLRISTSSPAPTPVVIGALFFVRSPRPISIGTTDPALLLLRRMFGALLLLRLVCLCDDDVLFVLALLDHSELEGCRLTVETTTLKGMHFQLVENQVFSTQGQPDVFNLHRVTAASPPCLLYTSPSPRD